jgi:hypothetical protein
LVYLDGGATSADGGVGAQVIVADTYNDLLRQLDVASGAVTTLPGLSFSYPLGLDPDGNGNLFVGAFSNYTVYEVNLAANTSTTVGASDNYVAGVALDGKGNLFVSDRRNGAILQFVLATGVMSTLAGSSGNLGLTDGVGSAARFHEPVQLVYDGLGDLYVADSQNNAIRKIVISTATVSTLAGG